MDSEVKEIPVFPVHTDFMVYYHKVFKIYKTGDDYWVKLRVDIYVHNKRLNRYRLNKSIEINSCPIDYLTQDKYRFGRVIENSLDTRIKYFFAGIALSFWTVEDELMKEIVDAVVKDCEVVHE